MLQQIADRDDNRKVLKSADPVAAYVSYLTAGAAGKRLVGDLTPEYGLLPVPVPTLNEILIQCQPAHAQLLGHTTDTAASDAWRADMVRGKLRRFAA